MRNIKFVDDMVKENQDNLLFSVEEFKANREVKMPSDVNCIFLPLVKSVNPQCFVTLMSN